MTAKNQPKQREQPKPWRVVGARLQEAMDAKKWRHIDLVVHAGVRRASLISDLVNDRDCNITLDTLGALCDALELSADWLCGKSDRGGPSKASARTRT